jgi:NAD(P)-dependent dehydrogenase (short-subunit alcohol dehydrogenase family)
MENRDSVVVVTGASSGIGNACATFLAKKGYRVYGTCRDPGSYARKADEFFDMLAMDLGDPGSIARAAEKTLAASGRVDALVCCAGSGLVGSIEDSSLEEAESIMDINFFGTLRTIKAFLPRMRAEGRGRIVIVGALEGLLPTPFQGLYAASEFALEGLAGSLRLEVEGFGLELCVVELGAFRTAFGQRRLIAVGATGASPYRPSLETSLGVLAREEASGAEPLIAARAIHSALSARRMPVKKTVGSPLRRILARSRSWLPGRVFERLLRKYHCLE